MKTMHDTLTERTSSHVNAAVNGVNAGVNIGVNAVNAAVNAVNAAVNIGVNAVNAGVNAVNAVNIGISALCAHCQHPFVATQSHQRFCKVSCRVASFNKSKRQAKTPPKKPIGFHRDAFADEGDW